MSANAVPSDKPPDRDRDEPCPAVKDRFFNDDEAVVDVAKKYCDPIAVASSPDENVVVAVYANS